MASYPAMAEWMTAGPATWAIGVSARISAIATSYHEKAQLDQSAFSNAPASRDPSQRRIPPITSQPTMILVTWPFARQFKATRDIFIT